MKNQKWMFLYALIIAFLVFNFGIFMGYMLEGSRINQINNWEDDANMQLIDQGIQKDASELFDLNCTMMINENIAFADSIYADALKIGEYEKASRLNDEILSLHKRFDLLRTLLWTNSIRIKQQCNANYHNVIYIYDYNDPTIAQSSEQHAVSNLLGELKNKYSDKIMLIPIAGDNDLPSLNLLANKFNVTEFPSVVIDEKYVLTNVSQLEDIEKYLN